MDIEKELREEAKHTAAQLEAQYSTLKRQQLELEAEAREKKAKADAVSGAPKRSLNFKPSLRGEFQCPRCWVKDGAKVNLVPKDSRAPNETDIIGCTVCSFDLAIPL